MAFLTRLFGQTAQPVDRTWRKKADTNHLLSDDDAASPVTEMQFGYHGEIFVRFADGRDTCIWPTGKSVWPRKIGVRLNRPTPEAERDR